MFPTCAPTLFFYFSLLLDVLECTLLLVDHAGPGRVGWCGPPGSPPLAESGGTLSLPSPPTRPARLSSTSPVKRSPTALQRPPLEMT